MFDLIVHSSYTLIPTTSLIDHIASLRSTRNDNANMVSDACIDGAHLLATWVKLDEWASFRSSPSIGPQ